MKKAFVAILAVLFTVAVLPQSGAANVGIKAGFNFANFKLSGGETPDFKNLTAPTAGFFWTINLGLFAIQPEVLYSQRGVKFQEEIEVDVIGDYKYMLHYVEVPVLLKLNVMPAGPIRPVIFAGPSFGYLISARGKVTVEGVSDSGDISDYFKKTEFAGVFGAGLEFKLAAIMLSVDARYHLGFSNIVDGEDAVTGKNKGISVLVGLGF